MRVVFLFQILIFFSLQGWAQMDSAGTGGFKQGSFVHLDMVYDHIKYEEPGVMNEEGGIGGMRGEIGFQVLNWVSLGIGGMYMDGRLFYDGSTFNGTPAKTITADYFRESFAKLHFGFSSFVFSLGYAQRYWYNDLIVSYRRRTEYTYTPVELTYVTTPFYATLSYYSWTEGENKSHMSDVDPARLDVTVAQKKGNGYALEVGRIIAASPISARVFLGYQKWDVERSEIGNDGTQNLVEPKNNTDTYRIGLGMMF
jgi:hypothetical protein